MIWRLYLLLTEDSSARNLFASSSVQHECIPQAILGMDVICQAKSGMGKTAVFVLSTLQQIEPVAGQVAALVLCHTRELAYQVGMVFWDKKTSLCYYNDFRNCMLYETFILCFGLVLFFSLIIFIVSLADLS